MTARLDILVKLSTLSRPIAVKPVLRLRFEASGIHILALWQFIELRNVSRADM